MIRRKVRKDEKVVLGVVIRKVVGRQGEMRPRKSLGLAFLEWVLCSFRGNQCWNQVCLNWAGEVLVWL